MATLAKSATSNSGASWDKRAQNILFKYNKSKTLTTDLLVEIINLMGDLRNFSYENRPADPGNPNTPPPFEDMTPEEIRDALNSLTEGERLDASSIKNVSENVFVKVNGADIPLQTFLQQIWDYINNLETNDLTREELVQILGFEPLGPDNIVSDLENPSENTVLSSEGLYQILQDFSGAATKVFTFSNAMQVTCIHEYDEILMPTIYEGNNLIFTYVENTVPGTTLIKFNEPITGKVFISKADPINI